MIDIFILKMKLFFFISKLLQHHSSILTNNWYSEWYISIFFIPAIFKHFSSSILVSFKYHSSLHYYSILLTILPNCAGPILPPATFQQCIRLNFCKEVWPKQSRHDKCSFENDRRHCRLCNKYRQYLTSINPTRE